MAGKKETKKTEEKKVEVTTPTKPIGPLPRAFYIEKIAGVWRFITADVDGDKLINKKVKDCDNKALSLEYYKLEFAKHYYFGR
jgi:hypothetical protein